MSHLHHLPRSLHPCQSVNHGQAASINAFALSFLWIFKKVAFLNKRGVNNNDYILCAIPTTSAQPTNVRQIPDTNVESYIHKYVMRSSVAHDLNFGAVATASHSGTRIVNSDVMQTWSFRAT